MTGTTATTTVWPRWVREVLRSLPVRPHIVLAGNVRDLYLVGGEQALLPLHECLSRALEPLGYRAIVSYDPVDGVRIHPRTSDARLIVESALGLQLGDGPLAMGPRKLTELLSRLGALRDRRLAIVIDYAARLVRNPQQLDDSEHQFFAACEKLAHQAVPVVTPDGPRTPLYNPVIWVTGQPNDLPAWFVHRNQRVWSHVISRPDHEARATAATRLLRDLPGFRDCGDDEREKQLRAFADQTEGLPLTSLIDIATLARGEGIPVGRIEEAVLLFKIGTADSPWKKDHLRARAREAETFIGNRVKGQESAIQRTVDIIKRSIVGLTGAHASSRGRPRGVLFFAGPTGVGKTELAKAITACLFSDERAYIRFDMSEFSAEHSDARLLGAPPGYVGFDAGGELTNAIRERPFSVVLFDEIEKAHPRILDKFLQLLEDGRLTDGSGNTVYFSEAVLIFTSNLGIFVDGADGGRVENVRPGMDYASVERRIRKAIDHHFKAVLNRPELLNRIGDNIVVFNFIEEPVAGQIFDMMLRNIVDRVQQEQRLTLEIPAAVEATLRARCTADLGNGGRGIGNALESLFVNPLARALFDRSPSPGSQLTVTDIALDGAKPEVTLS